MKPEVLSQLKQQLLDEQSRLEALVDRTAKHLYRRDEPYNADFAEQAVETQNNEVVEHIDDEAKLELKQIAHALNRIESGEYAICESCGDDIGEPRLSAIPHTNHCIQCANEISS